MPYPDGSPLFSLCGVFWSCYALCISPRHMKKFASLLFALLILSGCSRFGNSDDTVMMPTMGMDYDEAEEYKADDRSMMGGESGYAPDAEQKVIKTGTLSLHMEDVRESVDLIKEQVTVWGGEVTNTNVTRYSNSYYGSLTVRVPSDQFDTALTGLKEMAVYVESEYTNADNITEVYMDLEARLNNLKEEETQYLAILDKAVTVEEILNVTDYLSQVRYEIESLEGQLKYYDTNVDYSTITLTLTEDESVEAAQESWRPLSTFREALSDWMVFLQDFADAAIYLVIFGWPLILILLGAWLWKRSHTKRRK